MMANSITFEIKESEKFYVERINILGDHITTEQFIRNQLIVMKVICPTYFA